MRGAVFECQELRSAEWLAGEVYAFVQKALDEHGTRVAFGETGNAWGYTTYLGQDIVISSELRGDDPAALASLLAHEAYHVALWEPIGMTSGECVNHEINAIEKELWVWNYFYSGGKFKPGSTYELELNNKLHLSGDELRQYVRYTRRNYCGVSEDVASGGQ